MCPPHPCNQFHSRTSLTGCTALGVLHNRHHPQMQTGTVSEFSVTMPVCFCRKNAAHLYACYPECSNQPERFHVTVPPKCSAFTERKSLCISQSSYPIIFYSFPLSALSSAPSILQISPLAQYADYSAADARPKGKLSLYHSMLEFPSQKGFHTPVRHRELPESAIL